LVDIRRVLTAAKAVELLSSVDPVAQCARPVVEKL